MTAPVQMFEICEKFVKSGDGFFVTGLERFVYRVCAFCFMKVTFVTMMRKKDFSLSIELRSSSNTKDFRLIVTLYFSRAIF